ncbi:MAG: CRISPR-associated protein Cas10 [Spirulinaceae cyanobacterium SM2_1_0]|nr:CRISPR-associated protein Cas10 [Spirulinaceae cyanobacterium SM2_1_0]
MTYTAITFAPVQGFIEKSRKLRDLYGSSFILSYLAVAICHAARRAAGVPETNPPDEDDPVISPALLNVAQGTPNIILLKGHARFDKSVAQAAFTHAWKELVETCREWIEATLKGEIPYFDDDFSDHPAHQRRHKWQHHWEAWENHAWEFFYAQGPSINAARIRLNAQKRSRAWTGINWVGESSSLSGADAIAWPEMATYKPRDSWSAVKPKVDDFYQKLSQAISEAIIAPNERLSIPELTKRLITCPDIAERVPDEQFSVSVQQEIPASFRDLNRHDEEAKTGWFRGDGDRMGQYLKEISERAANDAERVTALRAVSRALMDWGEISLKPALRKPEARGQDAANTPGRIVYAGGDDFFGIFYRLAPDKLTARECLQWFYGFPDLWKKHGEDITASIGFVWAYPNVPQRDVLQHCGEAEQSAKRGGRDRLALRILFNSGNHLEWRCPWWFLQDVLEGYRDRRGEKGTAANWQHFYSDVAMLEARHAFNDQSDEVAIALFDIYFGPENAELLKEHRWGEAGKSGILRDRPYETDTANIHALNAWVINLAKVGFHLCQSPTNQLPQNPEPQKIPASVT